MTASAQSAPGEAPRLSAPERAVLGLVAEGLTNQDVGKRLYYTAATVHTMLGRMYRKFGVRNRAALVDRAWRHGYLPPLRDRQEAS